MIKTGERITGKFDKGVVDDQTITLEELCRRLKEQAYHYSTKKFNKILMLNAEAALRALGNRLAEADAQLAELQNKPLIVGPGGARVN